MNAIKFCKVDMIRSRALLKYMFILFVAVSIFFIFQTEDMVFSFVYMLFVAVIASGQPFNLERKNESGFVNLLPGTRQQRVCGRFLYAVILVIVCLFLSSVINIVYVAMGHEIPDITIPCTIGMVGVSLIVITIQYVILYLAGKGKSQQLLGIIQIIPGFVMFFGFSYLSDYVQTHHIDFETILENKYPIAIIALGIGMLVMLLGIKLCSEINQKKDFA